MDETLQTAFSQIDSVMKSMRQFNQLTIDLVGNSLTEGLKIWSKMSPPCGMRLSGCGRERPADQPIICPPMDLCLPRCLLTITRHARIGEVIIIPFKIRNKGAFEKTYQLGVRPLVDKEGNPIAKPTLDQLGAKVQPGLTVRREMRIEVGNGFVPGELYETDIVIREKAHNQNICVKLHTHPADDVPEAAPYDEKDLGLHFHRWYHHYYCREPLPAEEITGVLRKSETIAPKPKTGKKS